MIHSTTIILHCIITIRRYAVKCYMPWSYIRILLDFIGLQSVSTVFFCPDYGLDKNHAIKSTGSISELYEDNTDRNSIDIVPYVKTETNET